METLEQNSKKTPLYIYEPPCIKMYSPYTRDKKVIKKTAKKLVKELGKNYKMLNYDCKIVPDIEIAGLNRLLFRITCKKSLKEKEDGNNNI